MSLLECYTLEPATFSGNAPISSPTQARGRKCSHDRVDDGRGAARHRANSLNSHLAIQMGSDTSLLLYFFTHGEAAASGGQIGRASCRERGEMCVVGVMVSKK